MTFKVTLVAICLISLSTLRSYGAEPKPKVELLGIKADSLWWGADGKPLAEPPADDEAPRAWLGVALSSLQDGSNRKVVGFAGKEGAIVESVIPTSAAEGKLSPGDVITAINDKPIKRMQDVVAFAHDSKPGAAAN